MDLFTGIELCGIVAASISGSMRAIDKKTDVFGVLLLGATTALGGGLMRDLMLGDLPPRAFSSTWYIPVACGVSLLVFLFARFARAFYQREEKLIARVNNVFDALGLGSFAVSGTALAFADGYGDLGLFCIFLGMTTAVGGGMLRDVMLGEIPFVLSKRVYAVAAICGAAAYYFVVLTGGDTVAATIFGIGVVFILRILATIFRWNFPKAID